MTENKQKHRIIIHQDHCKACDLCIEYCPVRVLQKGDNINKLGYVATEYKGEGCIACGTCFYVCPEPGAITLIRHDKKREKP